MPRLQNKIEKAKDVFSIGHVVNVGLNTAETRLRRLRLKSLPQVVDVVLTKGCNLACVFCKDYDTPGSKVLPLADFREVAAQLFPSALGIRICSGGEPYLHPGLEDVLRISRSYKVSTRVLSNGMLLTEERVRPMVQEGLVGLHGFSVDGIRADTVEAIRVNAKLDTIIENIKMLLRIRSEEGTSRPAVVIQYALMRSNVEELPESVRFWGGLGVDRIDCGYLSLANDIDRAESLYFHQDLAEGIFAQAREMARNFPSLELNLPPTVAEAEAQARKPGPCLQPWQFAMIDTDGRVLPCYNSSGTVSMGTVFGDDATDFREIWNGTQYRELRRTVNDEAADKTYAYCSICPTRIGWGALESHLGDETWQEFLELDEAERGAFVARRSRLSGRRRPQA